MDIQLTGVLVSKTGDFINDYQEFDIQGGQEGLNSILAEELEPDTLYWIKGIFVKDGVEYESKPAQFNTARAEDTYLTLKNTSGETNTITMYGKSSAETPSFAITLDYSKNGGRTWTTWNSARGNLNVVLSVGESVMFKGSNAALGADRNGTYSYPAYIFHSTKSFRAFGNVMSLLDPTMTSTSVGNFALSKLFYQANCDIGNLVLPATTLGAGCYHEMFCNTNLTKAPKLPATNLAHGCYYRMFFRCYSLVTAPELPTTEMPQHASFYNGCYEEMFAYCRSLVNAPELPATTLSPLCYKQMFIACSSLVNAPALPATTLTPYCYQSMFAGTSLTTAPELPATTLDEVCYGSMFKGCTSLVNPPDLPATTLADGCYGRMFENCTSLTTAPELPATTLSVDNCYANMFNGCTSLNRIVTYANDIYGRNCIFNWLGDVSGSGDFYNLGSATYPSGASGIPSGWTEHTSI